MGRGEASLPESQVRVGPGSSKIRNFFPKGIVYTGKWD